jgi:hypothetical protein
LQWQAPERIVGLAGWGRRSARGINVFASCMGWWRRGDAVCAAGHPWVCWRPLLVRSGGVCGRQRCMDARTGERRDQYNKEYKSVDCTRSSCWGFRIMRASCFFGGAGALCHSATHSVIYYVTGGSSCHCMHGCVLHGWGRTWVYGVELGPKIHWSDSGLSVRICTHCRGG